MAKKILAGLVVLFGVMLTSTPAYGVTVTNNVCFRAQQQGGTPAFCDNDGQAENQVLGPDGLATKVLQIIVYVVTVVSVIMIIIGGLRYIIAAGDSNGIQGAKNTILYAIVGLIVALFAQVIVSLVLSKFV